MGSRVLEIIATLKDQVTDKLDQMGTGLNRLEKNLATSGRQAIMVGRTMEAVGRSFIFTGAAMTGPLFLAFNASAEYSENVNNALTRLKDTGLAFQVSIANALVPAINKMADGLAKMVNAWNLLSPAQQQAIVQIIFAAGEFLILTGTILTIVGAIIKFQGEMEKLGADLLKFWKKNGMVVLSTLAWAAAIAVLIIYWDQLKGVVIPILNGIEIAVDMVAIGFQKMLGVVVTGAIILVNKLHDIFMALGSIQGPQQQMFLNMAQGLQQASGGLQTFYAAQKKTILDLQNDILNILVTGKGGLSNAVDGTIKKIKDLFAQVNNLFNGQGTNIDAPVKYFDAFKDLAQKTAQSMTTSLADGFFDVVTGKFSDLQTVVQNWAQNVLKIIMQVLAKMLLINTIGQISLGGGIGKLAQYFHSGGIIKKAHDGMLAPDEVPLIAQTGEAILSRRAVSSLGAENVNRLNAGHGMGSSGQNIQITHQPTVVVQAWDTRDVMRNMGAINAALGQGLRTNTEIRQLFRQNN